jgi:hypothetical protein
MPELYNSAYAKTQTSDLSVEAIVSFDPQHIRREVECDACCPLCGTTKKVDAAHRSLSYNARTGLWRCARCLARGILREFRTEQPPLRPNVSRTDIQRARLRRRMAIQPVRSPESLPPTTPPTDWQGRFGPIVPLAGTPGFDYVQVVRKLPASLCHAGGVRFASNFFGRPAIVFPLRDREGDLVAAQGRYVDGRDCPRMRTAGTRKLGLFATLGAYATHVTGRLVVTEAPLDALTLAFGGVPAIALCGCEGVPDWFIRLAAFQTVYVAFDADDAGDRASAHIADILAPVGARVLRLRPENSLKDWNVALKEHGSHALRHTLANLLRTPPFFDPDWTAQLRAAAGPENGEIALDKAGFAGCAELAAMLISGPSRR